MSKFYFNGEKWVEVSLNTDLSHINPTMVSYGHGTVSGVEDEIILALKAAGIDPRDYYIAGIVEMVTSYSSNGEQLYISARGDAWDNALKTYAWGC